MVFVHNFKVHKTAAHLNISLHSRLLAVISHRKPHINYFIDCKNHSSSKDNLSFYGKCRRSCHLDDIVKSVYIFLDLLLFLNFRVGIDIKSSRAVGFTLFIIISIIMLITKSMSSFWFFFLEYLLAGLKRGEISASKIFHVFLCFVNISYYINNMLSHASKDVFHMEKSNSYFPPSLSSIMIFCPKNPRATNENK